MWLPLMMKVQINIRACGAEFLAMLLFVFTCAGSATGVAADPGWVQQVSLTFGLAITVLAYSIGHISGGQINCAVTFGLVLQGLLEWPQAVANVVAQLLGSLMGALLLAVVKEKIPDKTGTLGCNMIADNMSIHGALIGEIMMTFLLMFVVLQTAVSPKTVDNRSQAPLAIGFAVYLAHSFLIPVDGCSINPTRSFGPAVIASILHHPTPSLVGDIWKHHWVFWVGPFIGSAFAVLAFKAFDTSDSDEKSNAPIRSSE